MFHLISWQNAFTVWINTMCHPAFSRSQLSWWNPQVVSLFHCEWPELVKALPWNCVFDPLAIPWGCFLGLFLQFENSGRSYLGSKSYSRTFQSLATTSNIYWTNAYPSSHLMAYPCTVYLYFLYKSNFSIEIPHLLYYSKFHFWKFMTQSDSYFNLCLGNLDL